MGYHMNKLQLKDTRPVVGFGICLGSARIAEMVAQTNFDYVMVDLLHSHFSKSEATTAIRSLAGLQGPVAIGRVADNLSGSINELLDAGAMGIIVPMIESKMEAEQAVRAAYYPPLGTRSKGSPAAVFYGPDYYEKINGTLSVIVMIETPEAAENAEQILSVPGITGCLIGAGDLSYILQETGRKDQLDQLIGNVLSVGKSHNIAIGISVNKPKDLEYWWYKGMYFFLVSHDMAVLAEAIRSQDNKFKGHVVKERI